MNSVWYPLCEMQPLKIWTYLVIIEYRFIRSFSIPTLALGTHYMCSTCVLVQKGQSFITHKSTMTFNIYASFYCWWNCVPWCHGNNCPSVTWWLTHRARALWPLNSRARLWSGWAESAPLVWMNPFWISAHGRGSGLMSDRLVLSFGSRCPVILPIVSPFAALIDFLHIRILDALFTSLCSINKGISHRLPGRVVRDIKDAAAAACKNYPLYRE